jgi:predicted phage terminase large subunit-like protein
LKEKGDYSALTIWNVFYGADGVPGALLRHAWARRLEICGPSMPRQPGETDTAFRARTEYLWGLVEHLDADCRKFKVDELLIENKASGISVAQQMNKLFYGARYRVSHVDPGKTDKIARMLRVVPVFTAGQVWAPADGGQFKKFAAEVIDQCAKCPNGTHDDLCDSATYAIYYLRNSGWLERREEQFLRKDEMGKNWKTLKPLYNI